jgi:hypothetical protein
VAKECSIFKQYVHKITRKYGAMLHEGREGVSDYPTHYPPANSDTVCVNTPYSSFPNSNDLQAIAYDKCFIIFPYLSSLSSFTGGSLHHQLTKNQANMQEPPKECGAFNNGKHQWLLGQSPVKTGPGEIHVAEQTSPSCAEKSTFLLLQSPCETW